MTANLATGPKQTVYKLKGQEIERCEDHVCVI